MSKNNLLDNLYEIGNNIVKIHDIELVDVELVKEAGNWYLRYYIDKPGGVTIDDCQKVSEQLSDHLDVSDPISHSYILEVSSPGIERPLKNKKDFLKAINTRIEVKTYKPIENQKTFVGTLLSYSDEFVVIEVGKRKVNIPTNQISSAKTMFEWKGEWELNIEFIEAIVQIEKEKGIPKDVLFDALEASLISAYKKNYGTAQNVSVEINRDTGEVKVYSKKTVTESVQDNLLEIDIDDAIKINPTAEIGDIVSIEVTPKKFGRIAAQTAKQVVMQRIREAERDVIYEEFSGRETDIVTGIIQRFDKKNVIVDLGKIEVFLPASEQIPEETYKQGNRIKLYILEVDRKSVV